MENNISTPLTETDPYVLEIRGLKVNFSLDEGPIQAVRGVDLQVKRGKTLAVVGESGCGKSVTAYSILNLIQKPGYISAGEIHFHSRDQESLDIAELSEQNEKLFQIRGGNISMIFQEPMSAMSPVHTIGNQIIEAILLHQEVTDEKAEALAVEMLRKVGIPNAEGRLKQYPHELSGGMRQRVVIAMALVCRPEVLIADEPTTALDVTIQAQILKLIKEMQQELGMAVVFITHDFGVVAQIADEVAVMYLGRVVEKGTVRQVLKSPTHPYTRALLDSLPGYGDERGPLASIRGSVPSLHNIPPGCSFGPRCKHFKDGVCNVNPSPEQKELQTGHFAECHFAHDLYDQHAVEEGSK